MIVPTVTRRWRACSSSLAGAGGGFETIVVDNGTGAAGAGAGGLALDGCELLRLESNLGYSRAVNLAARRARARRWSCSTTTAWSIPAMSSGSGGARSRCRRGDGRRGDARCPSPGLIDTAGIELDRTLLAYDYLNGEPWTCSMVRCPTRSAPRERRPRSGERRSSRRMGSTRPCSPISRTSIWSCACAGREGRAGSRRPPRDRTALGDPGPGSARKDYLIGYGRGYLLRKWGVLSPGGCRGCWRGSSFSAEDRRSSTATSPACAAGCGACARHRRESRTPNGRSVRSPQVRLKPLAPLAASRAAAAGRLSDRDRSWTVSLSGAHAPQSSSAILGPRG